MAKDIHNLMTGKRPERIAHVIELRESGPPILATGARNCNTLCITRGDKAWLSQSLGNLDSLSAGANHEALATELIGWQSSIPALIARDIDPANYAVRYAIDLANNLGVPHRAIQHHHAHVAAVCAEHGLTGPIIGLVLDDAGMGTDGASWGGELLKVSGEKFERLGHLSPILQPGGDIVAHESWRLSLAVLHQLGRPDEIIRRYELFPASIEVTLMLSEKRNCPSTSSTSSLIAAVANLLHLIRSDDGDMDVGSLLEMAAQRYFTGDYARVSESLWQIDAAHCLDLYPLLERLIDEPDAGHGAATFYANLIAGATEWAAGACEYDGISRVVLAGSCMSNTMLCAGLRDGLVRRGLDVYEAREISCDDSSIALGQAWVALHAVKTEQSAV